MITASIIRDQVLEPALDARALNLEQAGRIRNATPQVDCLIDHLVRIRPDTIRERGHLVSAAALAQEIGRLNGHEGVYESEIAGFADTLAVDLRDIEVAGRAALSARSVARTLREPLRLLSSPTPPDALQIVDAVRAVDRILSSATTALVFSPAVRHELGVRKFALLRQLAARRTKSGTGRSLASGAATHETQPHGHDRR